MVGVIVGPVLAMCLAHVFSASMAQHVEITATGIGATIGPPQPNDLVVSNQIVTGTGRVVGQNGVIGPNGNLGVSDVKSNGTAVFTGVGPCPNRIPVSHGPHWHNVPATQALQLTASTCANWSPISRPAATGRCSSPRRRSSSSLPSPSARAVPGGCAGACRSGGRILSAVAIRASCSAVPAAIDASLRHACPAARRIVVASPGCSG